jgi:hypothetical protein
MRRFVLPLLPVNVSPSWHARRERVRRSERCVRQGGTTMRQSNRWFAAAVLATVAAVSYLFGAVGPQPGADGTYNLLNPRIDRTGAAVVQQSGGKYGETSIRGLTFTATDSGAGITPTTTISTTAMFVLYNPSGNNYRFRVQRVSLGYVSGTLSSGPVFHAGNISTAQAAPTGGTLLTNRCLDIGSGTVGTGVCRTGATVAAGTVAFRPLATLAPMLATTVVAPFALNEDVDGEFVVEPGASYQVQSVQAGAGTSPLVTLGVSWTEEPIR